MNLLLLLSCALLVANGFSPSLSLSSLARSNQNSAPLSASSCSLRSRPTTRAFSSQQRLWATNVPETPETVTLATKNVAANNGDASTSIEALQEELSIDATSAEIDASDAEYKKGILTIGFICLLNSSLAPVWHIVFEGNGPPPLFLNAIVSITALVGLLVGGSFLDSKVEKTEALAGNADEKWSAKSFRGGIELGLWKGLGTTCHIFGMALTTANHGAFLLQLTTLIVPVIQGLQGEKIPRQIQLAVVLALAGIIAFTQDPVKAADAMGDPAQMQNGDLLVLAAAFFYSLYDIQTFYWGREVPRTELVTIKIGFQAVLSCTLCAVAARTEVMDYLASGPEWGVLIPTMLWSGLIVNALATFLQVGGMQSVGPTRAQTIFASQPLWAACLNYVFIGEIMGVQGFVGGGAFLGALLLAATAEAPKPKMVGSLD